MSDFIQRILVTLILALAVILAPVFATAAEVLTGEAALESDWTTSAPGVRRLITPADLPPPYATRSSGNSPGVVRRPADTAPVVPEGFVARLVAEGLNRPRTLRVAPNGDIFVVESAAGRVTLLGRNGERSAFVSGLTAPYGLAFYPANAPKWVYVAETGRIVRYAYTPGAPAGAAEVIVPELPTGGHWTREIAFSKDGGTMFVAIGSRSNVADRLASLPAEAIADYEAATGRGAAWGGEQDRAVVLAFGPDGTRLGTWSTGLRNCTGTAVQPATGDLWCVVNERDGLGDNLPPDFATALREGAFYGWPWFYIGANQDPRHAGQRADLADEVSLPDVLFQAHSAPIGIAFYEGGSFPEAYRGDAFVTLRGSWNRESRTGYKVVRMLFEDGQPTGVYEDFATGFVVSAGSVWGRPTGITVDKDGALLVSEDANGTIWRIEPAN